MLTSKAFHFSFQSFVFSFTFHLYCITNCLNAKFVTMMLFSKTFQHILILNPIMLPNRLLLKAHKNNFDLKIEYFSQNIITMQMTQIKGFIYIYTCYFYTYATFCGTQSTTPLMLSSCLSLYFQVYHFYKSCCKILNYKFKFYVLSFKFKKGQSFLEKMLPNCNLKFCSDIYENL